MAALHRALTGPEIKLDIDQYHPPPPPPAITSNSERVTVFTT